MILCGFVNVCSTAAKSPLLKDAKITLKIAVGLSPEGCGITMAFNAFDENAVLKC
jgi:hypothetical protein